jgi:hypothetical protein
VAEPGIDAQEIAALRQKVSIASAQVSAEKPA